MNILGISFGLDAAAAFVRDGRIVAAAADERFTRRKHSDAFPVASIEYCLAEAGAGLADLDAAAFFWNPGLHLQSFNRRFATHYRHHLEYLISAPMQLLRLADQAGESTATTSVELVLRRGDAGDLRTVYVTHHLAHAASAFYPSPFDEAAILTLDGYGERACALLAVGRGHRIEPLAEIEFPHSLGAFYAAVTQYLGFQANNEEGTVMALAAYGEPAYLDAFERIVRVRGESVEIDQSYFTFGLERPRRYSPKFVREFGPERRRGEPIAKRHQDLAASAQRVLEKAIVSLARRLQQRTGLRRLCMAGGVALNSVANGEVLHRTRFDELFVQPAAGDSGAALGAALYVNHMLLGRKRRYRMKNDFLGPGYSDPEIRAALEAAKARFSRPRSIARAAAERLARGEIVGWFQGRMEFGPRALGGRSILAHPGLPDMKDVLNARVKHRESFRPFAPAVLAEEASRFFDLGQPAPFMLKVAKVKPRQAPRIPAVVHADGTARLQTVDAAANPAFHRLIREFHALTGLPLVLNTSFNIKGEPIVCTPADALRCFYSTGMDALAIGGYLVTK